MTTDLPFKQYYTLDEAANLLECKPSDFIHWWRECAIDLCIKIDCEQAEATINKDVPDAAAFVSDLKNKKVGRLNYGLSSLFALSPNDKIIKENDSSYEIPVFIYGLWRIKLRAFFKEGQIIVLTPYEEMENTINISIPIEVKPNTNEKNLYITAQEITFILSQKGKILTLDLRKQYIKDMALHESKEVLVFNGSEERYAREREHVLALALKVLRDKIDDANWPFKTHDDFVNHVTNNCLWHGVTKRPSDEYIKKLLRDAVYNSPNKWNIIKGLVKKGNKDSN
ncbi:hypothetical protein JF069_002938 [Salmonella enterica]|nr:hypothetical protein [Salmonella enterica]EDP9751251.1 hypothetical protein [Salmonella enterica subsp. enterica serovar Ealing]EGV1225208.1 hypothetical protein [Salmonella enterica]EJH2823097.1 hypothetical protein [Salmonella enterica]EJH9343151.1 hypothetical protein [Salmonella enterica]